MDWILTNSEQKEKQQLGSEEKHWIAMLFAYYVFNQRGFRQLARTNHGTKPQSSWLAIKADFYSYLETCEFADNF